MRSARLITLSCSCASVSAQSAGQKRPGIHGPTREHPQRSAPGRAPQEPRNISDSPFGIMTTICAEGGPHKTQTGVHVEALALRDYPSGSS